MKLEFKELEIELGLDGLIQVEAFQLVQGLNDHAFLSIKFLVEEETSEEFVNLASVFPVIIREKVYTKGQIIFQGKAENVYTRVKGDFPICTLTLTLTPRNGSESKRAEAS